MYKQLPAEIETEDQRLARERKERRISGAVVSGAVASKAAQENIILPVKIPVKAAVIEEPKKEIKMIGIPKAEIKENKRKVAKKKLIKKPLKKGRK